MIHLWVVHCHVQRGEAPPAPPPYVFDPAAQDFAHEEVNCGRQTIHWSLKEESPRLLAIVEGQKRRK